MHSPPHRERELWMQNLQDSKSTTLCEVTSFFFSHIWIPLMAVSLQNGSHLKLFLNLHFSMYNSLSCIYDDCATGDNLWLSF